MLKPRNAPRFARLRTAHAVCSLLVGLAAMPGAGSAQPAAPKATPFSIVAGPQTSALVDAITSAVKAKNPGESVTTVVTSTSNGISRFCASMNMDAPAAIITSRPLAGSEIERCVQAGVTDLSEAQFGYFAIMLVQKAADPKLDLTNNEIYRALAQEVPTESLFTANTARTWRDVNPMLPATDIAFYTTSPAFGSRAAFDAEALVGGCRKVREIKLIFEATYRVAKCITMRSSVVTEIDDTKKRVEAFRASAPGSIALMTYDAYSQNSSWMRIVPVNGFEPTPSAIYSDDYTMATPIYIYAKKKFHAAGASAKNQDPALRLWLTEALSDGAIGPGGYLERLGLIPMPTAKRGSQRAGSTNN